jgi:WXG100 family type VII secretion target
MSDLTQVNAAAMQTGIQDLGQAYKGLTQNLEQLKGELNQSLAQWDGAARQAYADVQQQWDASAQKMADITNKMTLVLGQISQGYDDNERTIQGNWS